jgi:hypothetical protein
MHGKTQDIMVGSSPTEAKVTILGESKTTPTMFNLQRKHSYIVKITKDGCEPAEVMITNKLDWTAYADLFIWGVLPIFVDLGTGAAWKLVPEDINVSLNCSIGSSGEPEQIPVSLKVIDAQLVGTTDCSDVTITVTRIE